MPTELEYALTNRQRWEIMRGEMEAEFFPMKAYYEDLAEYYLPCKPRMWLTNKAKNRRNTSIVDGHATLSGQIFGSGMLVGACNPAQPWFALETPDPVLMEMPGVKEYNDDVRDIIVAALLRSNFYPEMGQFFEDLGFFGTPALYVHEDPEKFVRFEALQPGTFMIAHNAEGEVDAFMEIPRMTVRQLVGKFGKRDLDGKIDWSNFSQHVKDQWYANRRETWVDVVHVVVPNDDYDPEMAEVDARYKRYVSCYYERGVSGQSQGKDYMAGRHDDRYLRESGYDYFPLLTARWKHRSDDVYASDCPGMAALGDTKQLQHGEKRGAKATDKMVDPSVVGPPEAQQTVVSMLPGGLTALRETSDSKLRALHDVTLRIDHHEAKQQELRKRISRYFSEDLFLMLAQSDRRDFTATEIHERRNEKMMVLGRVLGQVNPGVLGKVVDILYTLLDRAGKLPEPPPALFGVELKVKYVSILAEAERAVGLGNIDRFMTFVAELVKATKDITLLDNVDLNEAIREYGTRSAVAARILRSKEEVAGIREHRAQAEEAQQAAAIAEQASIAAKNLSQADMGGDTALSRLAARGAELQEAA